MVHVHFVKSEIFSLIWSCDRVSETQVQVGENLNWIIWRYYVRFSQFY